MLGVSRRPRGHVPLRACYPESGLFEPGPKKLPFTVMRNSLATAVPMAPVAVRELLIERLRDRDVPTLDRAHWEKYLVFDRELYCPFTWRI